MDTIEIREAKITDAEFIALLGRVTFTETFGHLFRNQNELLDYYSKTFSVKKIKKSLTKSNTYYWIAFVNELPVGYSKLKLNSPSEFIDCKNASQLQKIYVLKDFLPMKIGLELQNILIDKAKNKQRTFIWLSVLYSNKELYIFILRMVLLKLVITIYKLVSKILNLL